MGARVLDRSDVLGLLGLAEKPVVLQESKVVASQSNHPLMTASVWKKLPGWLDNPAAVFDSDTESGRLVFVAPEMVSGAPVVMILEPNPVASGKAMSVSLLVNAYDKSGGAPFGRWIADGLMKFADTKTFPAVFAQSVGRRLPDTALKNKPGTERILTEKQLSGYRRANTPAAFQGPVAEASAESNARLVATQLLVDELKSGWTRAPEIIVARDMQDGQIPQRVRDYDAQLKSQGSDGEARGFIYKGKVYLLADQLNGPAQIAEVLFHEVLGHYGLRGAFGDGLTPVLQQIGTMRRAQVLAKAREYGMVQKGLSDSDTWAAMSARDRLSAAEEVLAEMAQTTPEIGFVQRAIAAIRTWLRANVPGVKALALTDDEIVRNYILPARGYVTRSDETPQQSLERALLAFSRDANATMTNRNVVGNQGGRSADDLTPSVRAARQILDAIRIDDDSADYALRVILGEFNGAINTGDTLPPSKRWADGNETNEQLGGTSAVRIRRLDEKSILEALQDLGALGKNGPNGYYFGNRIALVKGDSIGSGEDVGESIIAGAEVVGIWKKPTNGLSEIQPNEPSAPDSGGAMFNRSGMADDVAKRVGAAVKSVTAAHIKQRAGFKLTDYLGIGLQALGRCQIVDIYGDMLPLAEYNRLVQQMEADKNEGGAEADQLATRWAKLPDEKKLAELMHDATLAQIDPARGAGVTSRQTRCSTSPFATLNGP